MKKQYLIDGFVYFLELQAITLILAFTTGFFTLLIRMLTYNEVARLIWDIVFSFSVELFIVFFSFCRKKVADRRSKLKDILLPLFGGLLLHFLIALWNGFYHYTAGPGVAQLGLCFLRIMENDWTIIDRRGYSMAPFIYAFLIKLVLIPLVAIIGYKLGERRLRRARERMLTQEKRT